MEFILQPYQRSFSFPFLLLVSHMVCRSWVDYSWVKKRPKKVIMISQPWPLSALRTVKPCGPWRFFKKISHQSLETKVWLYDSITWVSFKDPECMIYFTKVAQEVPNCKRRRSQSQYNSTKLLFCSLVIGNTEWRFLNPASLRSISGQKIIKFQGL